MSCVPREEIVAALVTSDKIIEELIETIASSSRLQLRRHPNGHVRVKQTINNLRMDGEIKERT